MASTRARGSRPARSPSHERSTSSNPSGNRNGVGGQPGHRSVEQDIAGQTSPIEIRGQRHNMGLPDIGIENVVAGHDNTRPTLVKIDPIHPATHYHGADRSIRSPTAIASSAVSPSGATSAASATS